MIHPVPSNEGRLISVVRCWGGERWLVGVSEIRRNKPISGPSRLVPARQPRVTGAEVRVRALSLRQRPVNQGSVPEDFPRIAWKPRSGG